jgi:hypothetical protein
MKIIDLVRLLTNATDLKCSCEHTAYMSIHSHSKQLIVAADREKWNESRHIHTHTHTHTKKNLQCRQIQQTNPYTLQCCMTSQSDIYYTQKPHQSHNTSTQPTNLHISRGSCCPSSNYTQYSNDESRKNKKLDELDGVCGEGRSSSQESHLDIRIRCSAYPSDMPLPVCTQEGPLGELKEQPRANYVMS